MLESETSTGGEDASKLDAAIEANLRELGYGG
jgi:hypothetical protein